jgi:hypothetical protein
MTRLARRRPPHVSLLVALVLSLCSLSSAQAAVPRAPVTWGVYVPGAPTSLAGVRSLGADAGKPPGIVMWYPTWGGPFSDVKYSRADVDAVLASGAVPMLTWMTWDPPRAGEQPKTTYSNTDIAAGAKDAYITSWARSLAAAPGTVYLRLDHEMNGIWYPWSPGQGNSTAANYIAMWRHVHDVFVREGATNVRWVWSPNVSCGGCTELADLYPGDAYVDWLALDGYNFGTANGHAWQSFDQVYRRSYNDILRLAKKPLMIAEMGTVERGTTAAQTKAAWITDALKAIRTRYPAFRAFVWFEQDNGADGDFRIRSAARNVQAFRAALRSSLFVSRPLDSLDRE